MDLRELLDTTERLWPAAGAEAWDAVGLVVGDPEASVARVHLAVDPVAAVVDEALGIGADLIVAHHPLLLRGVTSVAESRYKGNLVARLVRADCALLTAHTNADVVADGTSAILAARLGLVDATAIVPAAEPATGLGRIGTLAAPTTVADFAQVVAAELPATTTGIRVAGEPGKPVRTVAVCGGAGDSLLGHPAVLGADVFVTADLRHHPASESREQSLRAGGPALIDVSHWASESLWLEAAAAQLRAEHPELIVTVSTVCTDPWDFIVRQEEAK
ncbi:MAG TPA: Nif3-like dinuclear metal center hexameric protein [Candidatus Lumbricidophila sp.]|nr:Nif3-like dinuclear metal center hexameric protein [Candidatus Lumbricidophila sp.]